MVKNALANGITPYAEKSVYSQVRKYFNFKPGLARIGSSKIQFNVQIVGKICTKVNCKWTEFNVQDVNMATSVPVV